MITVTTPPVPFRQVLETLTDLTARSQTGRVFRTVKNNRLILLDLDATTPLGVSCVYAFHSPPASFPDFFRDIVPRLLDMKYGPDVAPLINTCVFARTCPIKSNGILDWSHDITYRAHKDSKWKIGQLLYSSRWKQDNWLHIHLLASFVLKKKKKIAYYREHRVPRLCCHHEGFDDGRKTEYDPKKIIICQCGKDITCEFCNDSEVNDYSLDTCGLCKEYLCVDYCNKFFCEKMSSPDCLSSLCYKCEKKSPHPSCDCHQSICPPCLDGVKLFTCIVCQNVFCDKYKGLSCTKCKNSVCKNCRDDNDIGISSSCSCHGFLCPPCQKKHCFRSFECNRCDLKSCIDAADNFRCSLPNCDIAVCEECVSNGYDTVDSLKTEGWTTSETTGEPLCNFHNFHSDNIG